MREIEIDKVTVHVGVGESGKRLVNAENILFEITHQKNVRALSKSRIPTFGIKKGEPIGCKVTLRGEKAYAFLDAALAAIDHKVYASQFDATGNISFGIEEHTDFPNMTYDPDIGIFGMDVCVSLKRPGYRVSRRRIQQHKISHKHRLTADDALSWMRDRYNLEVLE
ncbi:MAG TPA: 50S ribosomal protein L5 [Methanosarcinales archaeon]|nr:50S ribosomal protein L5 [Methanosarcinales archaeon]